MKRSASEPGFIYMYAVKGARRRRSDPMTLVSSCTCIFKDCDTLLRMSGVLISGLANLLKNRLIEEKNPLPSTLSGLATMPEE